MIESKADDEDVSSLPDIKMYLKITVMGKQTVQCTLLK